MTEIVISGKLGYFRNILVAARADVQLIVVVAAPVCARAGLPRGGTRRTRAPVP